MPTGPSKYKVGCRVSRGEPTIESCLAMRGDFRKPNAGERVVLIALPPGFLDGLPDEDQRAITAIVGEPVLLLGYDDDGRAELEFDDPFVARTDTSSYTHKIWVAPELIKPHRELTRGQAASGPSKYKVGCRIEEASR